MALFAGLHFKNFCQFNAYQGGAPTSWHSSMAQSIIREGLLFLAVHFEGFIENYPFLFEGLQNILKGMWRARPQNKGNSPSNLLLAA